MAGGAAAAGTWARSRAVDQDRRRQRHRGGFARSSWALPSSFFDRSRPGIEPLQDVSSDAIDRERAGKLESSPSSRISVLTTTPCLAFASPLESTIMANYVPDPTRSSGTRRHLPCTRAGFSGCSSWPGCWRRRPPPGPTIAPDRSGELIAVGCEGCNSGLLPRCCPRTVRDRAWRGDPPGRPFPEALPGSCPGAAGDCWLRLRRVLRVRAGKSCCGCARATLRADSSVRCTRVSVAPIRATNPNGIPWRTPPFTPRRFAR